MCITIIKGIFEKGISGYATHKTIKIQNLYFLNFIEKKSSKFCHKRLFGILKIYFRKFERNWHYNKKKI